jgi:hypothetical protein
MDVKGNWAPDGIMGPYREKEASYYTIKQIWSPVQLPGALPAGISPARCRWKIITSSRILSNAPSPGNCGSSASPPASRRLASKALFASPDVAPGGSGNLKFNLPADWKNADALAVTARNPPARNCGHGFIRCRREIDYAGWFAGAHQRLRVTN